MWTITKVMRLSVCVMMYYDRCVPLPPPPAGLPGLPDPSKLLEMMQQAKAETPTGG